MENCVTDGSQTVSVVKDLECDHEECDTRVFLLANHAAQEHEPIITKSPDTDVALNLQRDFPCSLYFSTGVGKRTRIIDLAKVLTALGNSVCLAFIGIHTFSGCDFTSAFHGKGKRKTLRAKRKNTCLHLNIWETVLNWTSLHLMCWANMCATCMACHLQ